MHDLPATGGTAQQLLPDGTWLVLLVPSGWYR